MRGRAYLAILIHDAPLRLFYLRAREWRRTTLKKLNKAPLPVFPLPSLLWDGASIWDMDTLRPSEGEEEGAPHTLACGRYPDSSSLWRSTSFSLIHSPKPAPPGCSARVNHLHTKSFVFYASMHLNGTSSTSKLECIHHKIGQHLRNLRYTFWK